MKKMISFTVTLALLLSVLAGVGLPAKEVNAATNKVLTTAIQASEPTTTNAYELDVDTVALTIPVSIQKVGIMEMRVSFQGFSEKAYCILQKNEKFSPISGSTYSMDVHSVAQEFTAEYTASQPTTCYLLLMTTGADESKAGSVTVTTTFQPATAGREVKPGEMVNAVQVSKEEYYKIKLDTPKKVILNGDYTGLELYNASKRYISGCDKTMYLKKGTYYLRHRGSGKYSFSYTTKKITLPKNTSRRKAKKIKLNKTIKGIFPRNTKTQSYWYKITLKKNKKLKVKYKNTVADVVQAVRLYSSKGKAIGMMDGLYIKGKKGTKKMISYAGKKPTAMIKKGTYYIQIEQSLDSEFTLTFQ